MTAALLACALASLWFSYSQNLTAASIGRLLIGGTVAFGFVSTLTIAGYWFPARRFALLSGILTTVGMMGAILGQAPLRIAVEEVGWRHTVLGLGVIAVILAVLIFLIVPHRSPAQLATSGSGTPKPEAGVGGAFPPVRPVAGGLGCSFLGHGGCAPCEKGR